MKNPCVLAWIFAPRGLIEILLSAPSSVALISIASSRSLSLVKHSLHVDTLAISCRSIKVVDACWCVLTVNVSWVNQLIGKCMTAGVVMKRGIIRMLEWCELQLQSNISWNLRLFYGTRLPVQSFILYENILAYLLWDDVIVYC